METDSCVFQDHSLYTDIAFFPFSPPPIDPENTEEWTLCLNAIDKDLHYLLKLPHKKFWAQAVQDRSLHLLIDSYLQFAPRPYERPWNTPPEIKETLRMIHKRMFLSLLRLSTHQETKESEILSSLYGDLLYNHYLFDMPRILDMCSVYGDSNPELLGKMISNVFTKQPKYWQDLARVLEGVAKVLDTLKSSHKPEGGGALTTTDDIDPQEVSKGILYFADIVHTLKSLVVVYPPTCHTLWITGIPERFVAFFEDLVPLFKSQWKHITKDDVDNEFSQYVSMRFGQALVDSTHLINILIMEGCGLVGGDKEAEFSLNLDLLMSLFTAMTTEKIFLKEFESHHSLRECLQLAQRYFDESQIEYILSAADLQLEPDEERVKSKPRPHSGEPKPKHLEEKIRYIKDILPDKESEFIKKCLKEFHYDQEITLERILEDHLPPHLTAPTEDVLAMPLDNRGGWGLPEAQMVDSRSSVFDYDEFDMLHRQDIDWDRVHVGKRHQSSRSILSDRSHIPLMKGRGLDLLPEYDEYDDEYDDTYDSHNIGATDQDSADELPAVQRLNVKGSFTNKHHWEGAGSIEGAGADSDPTGHVTVLKRPSTESQNPRNPSKNPNKQKKIAELKVHVNSGKQPKVAEREVGKKEEDKKEEDKKQGNGKGAESTTGGNTQHYRQHKERNKSSRANHNRKAGADRKRKAF